MSEAKIIGRVHLIEPTKSYGQKGFRKRLVVLEQDTGRFTNYIPVEFTNDGCDSADELNVGDDIEITYRLSGRKWQRDPASEAKYFLSAEAVHFRPLGPKGPSDSQGDPNDQFAEASSDGDDSPF